MTKKERISVTIDFLQTCTGRLHMTRNTTLRGAQVQYPVTFFVQFKLSDL